MCLTYQGEFAFCKIGFKIFIPDVDMYNYESRVGDVYGEFKGKGMRRPVEQWLNEKDYRPHEISKEEEVYIGFPGSSCAIGTIDGQNWFSDRSSDPIEDKYYPIGWHIFHDLEDAKEWRGMSNFLKIHRVRVREPRTTGYQEMGARKAKITVCGEIYIERYPVC